MEISENLTCGKTGFVHLGNGVAVYRDDIVGVFDLERTSVVKSVNGFLSAKQKAGKIYYCSLDMPASFTVTKETVYVSNVAAGTVRKRVNSGFKKI